MCAAKDSIIYVQVAPQHIADVNWIMEGYEHLALVSTVDANSGLIKLYATPDTYADALAVICNLPFAAQVYQDLEQFRSYHTSFAFNY